MDRGRNHGVLSVCEGAEDLGKRSWGSQDELHNYPGAAAVYHLLLIPLSLEEHCLRRIFFSYSFGRFEGDLMEMVND